MQDTKKHPSKKYIARASEAQAGKFRGQFSLPGLTPGYVQENGSQVLYPSADAAELAAARVMIKMANDRVNLRTNFQPARTMTAAELSSVLDYVQISPSRTVEVLQTEHVMAWLGGERRVPHMARIILELMMDPTIKEKVMAITARAVKEGQKS